MRCYFVRDVGCVRRHRRALQAWTAAAIAASTRWVGGWWVVSGQCVIIDTHTFIPTRVILDTHTISPTPSKNETQQKLTAAEKTAPKQPTSPSPSRSSKNTCPPYPARSSRRWASVWGAGCDSLLAGDLVVMRVFARSCGGLRSAMLDGGGMWK